MHPLGEETWAWAQLLGGEASGQEECKPSPLFDLVAVSVVSPPPFAVPAPLPLCTPQLPELLSGEAGGQEEYKPSPFFSEQLTAFELWLEHGSPDKRPPEQLPIVLQVCGCGWVGWVGGRVLGAQAVHGMHAMRSLSCSARQ